MNQLIHPYMFVGLCGGDTGITKKNMDNMPDDFINMMLEKRLAASPKNELMEKCISVSCEFFNVDRITIFEKDRETEKIETKYTIMYIMWKYFEIKKISIARYLKLDHSTITQGINKVKKKIEGSERYNTQVQTIVNKVLSLERDSLQAASRFNPIRNQNQV